MACVDIDFDAADVGVADFPDAAGDAGESDFGVEAFGADGADHAMACGIEVVCIDGEAFPAEGGEGAIDFGDFADFRGEEFAEAFAVEVLAEDGVEDAGADDGEDEKGDGGAAEPPTAGGALTFAFSAAHCGELSVAGGVGKSVENSGWRGIGMGKGVDFWLKGGFPHADEPPNLSYRHFRRICRHRASPLFEAGEHAEGLHVGGLSGAGSGEPVRGGERVQAGVGHV